MSGPADTTSPRVALARPGDRLPADMLGRIKSVRRRTLLAICEQCLVVVLVGWIVGAGFMVFYGGVLGGTAALDQGIAIRVVLVIGCLFGLAYLPWLTYVVLRRHQLVLVRVHARDPHKAEDTRLSHVLSEVALAANIRRPLAAVLDESAPNGFVVDSDAGPRIILTTGLLDLLRRDELEAVVGHLVARAIGGDLRYESVLAGNLAALSTILEWGFTAPVVLPCYGIATLQARRISRDRVELADQVAVALTRDPQALVCALEEIYRDPNETSGLPKRLAMLTFVDPQYPATMMGPPKLRARPWSDDKGTAFHPPLAERVERLRSLYA